MNRLPPAIIFMGLLALLPRNAALADTPAPILSNMIKVDMVVDVTDEGKKLARPTPEKPAYYFPLPVGYKQMGRVLSRYNRPPPSTPEVEGLLTQAFAAQGYLIAAKQTPPTIALAYAWGYIAPEILKDKTRKFAGASFENQAEMLSMVGGETVDTINPKDPRMQAVVQSARYPRYYLLISAYDFQAWLQHQTVLLWRAHVSCPMAGHRLEAVLPTLIATSAPIFGRETAVPIVADTPSLGRVALGEPVVAALQPAPAPGSLSPASKTP